MASIRFAAILLATQVFADATVTTTKTKTKYICPCDSTTITWNPSSTYWSNYTTSTSSSPVDSTSLITVTPLSITPDATATTTTPLFSPSNITVSGVIKPTVTCVECGDDPLPPTLPFPSIPSTTVSVSNLTLSAVGTATTSATSVSTDSTSSASTDAASTTITTTTSNTASPSRASSTCVNGAGQNYIIQASASGTSYDGQYVLLKPTFTNGNRLSITGTSANAQVFTLNCDGTLATSDQSSYAMIGGTSAMYYVYVFPTTAMAQAATSTPFQFLSCSASTSGTLACQGGGASIFQTDNVAGGGDDGDLELGAKTYTTGVTMNLIPSA